MRNHTILSLLFAVAISTACMAQAQEEAYTRTRSVAYGERDGRALTMDIFSPKANANGRGIVFIVSAGWGSSKQVMEWILPHEFIRRGYTVFAAQHGSVPKHNIPEIVEDVNRAVRFVRHHAKRYGVDAEKLGVFGASAGGHLSLMVGTAGGPGDPQAADPVDRESSRVQAVGCFFPPTDFLNYGTAGQVALGEGVLANFASAFDFQEFSKETRRNERITDTQARLEIGRKISPVNHATSDDPPTMVVHGDQDKLVPFQQGRIIIEKLQSVGVKAELVVRPGADHGWDKWTEDLQELADWFDQHIGR